MKQDMTCCAHAEKADYTERRQLHRERERLSPAVTVHLPLARPKGLEACSNPVLSTAQRVRTLGNLARTRLACQQHRQRPASDRRHAQQAAWRPALGCGPARNSSLSPSLSGAGSLESCSECLERRSLQQSEGACQLAAASTRTVPSACFNKPPQQHCGRHHHLARLPQQQLAVRMSESFWQGSNPTSATFWRSARAPKILMRSCAAACCAGNSSW